MEVVVKSNPANAHMYNAPYVAGVLPVPDDHFKPVLYSDYEATQQFKQLNEDIYVQKEKSKPIDRKKTPKAVLCALGTGVLFILYKIVKKRF